MPDEDKNFGGSLVSDFRKRTSRENDLYTSNCFHEGSKASKIFEIAGKATSSVPMK